MRKFLSIILVIVMTLAMTNVAFADPDVTPEGITADDTQTSTQKDPDEKEGEEETPAAIESTALAAMVQSPANLLSAVPSEPGFYEDLTYASATAGADRTYHIYLPQGYGEDPTRRYPSVFVMPYDGYSAGWYIDGGIADRLDELMAQDSILPTVVIFPEFETADSAVNYRFRPITAELIAHIDANYLTQSTSSGRGVLGAGAGAHMAAVAATHNLTTGAAITAPMDPGFIAIGSIMGNFTEANDAKTGSANPWLHGATLGYTRLNALTAANLNGSATANGFYVYIDGGTSDHLTSRDNSTADLVRLYRGKAAFDISRAYFTIHAGGHTAEFFMNSLEDCLEGFSGRFLGMSGTAANIGLNDNTSAEASIIRATNRNVTTTPGMLTEDDEKLTVDYSFASVTRKLARFTSGGTLGMDVKLVLRNADTGEIAYTAINNIPDVTTGATGTGDYITRTGSFTVGKEDIPASSFVKVELFATFLGKDTLIKSLNVVNIIPPGEEPHEQVIDLMGQWHFLAYKTGNTSGHVMDKVTYHMQNGGTGTFPLDWKTWGTVVPGLAWWDGTFASSANNNLNTAAGGGATTWPSNGNFAGHAWYIREFYVPENASSGGWFLSGGMFDEENIMYINGVMVGALGYGTGTTGTAGGSTFPTDGAVGDGSNPWDIRCEYDVPDGVIKPGEINTIYVRMRNSTGGGGWYSGPIGLFSQPALRKTKGQDYILASESDANMVKQFVQSQSDMLANAEYNKYAATVAGDFFQSGYNQIRWLERISGWLNSSPTGITTTDSSVHVYDVDGSFLYVTDRVIKSKATGATLESGQMELGFKVINGELMLTGAPVRVFYDRVAASSNRRIAVFLPKSYFEPGNENKRYPVQYLAHGNGSSADTWVVEKLNDLMDPAVEAGEIEEMILVASDNGRSSPTSMDIANISAHMDKYYRTIPDRRFRSMAGFSMGGGATWNALADTAKANLIGSYTGFSPYSSASQYTGRSVEFLNTASHYMVCGNIDEYSSIVTAVANAYKDVYNRGVDYFAEIGIGEHKSEYYMPHFIPQVKWHQERSMPFGTTVGGGVVTGGLTPAADGEVLSVGYSAAFSDDIKGYMTQITTSTTSSQYKYLDLTVPVTVRVKQGGKIVYEKSDLLTVPYDGAKNFNGGISVPKGFVDLGKACDVELFASVMDATILLSTETLLPPVVEVTSVKIDGAAIQQVRMRNTKQFTATVNPANATDPALTWASSNEKIFTVKDGLVTGVGTGSAKLIITANNGTTSFIMVQVTA